MKQEDPESPESLEGIDAALFERQRVVVRWGHPGMHAEGHGFILTLFKDKVLVELTAAVDLSTDDIFPVGTLVSVARYRSKNPGNVWDYWNSVTPEK